MEESTKGPVEVILKSNKLQKQYSLDVDRQDKLKNVAAFLLTLKEMGQFTDEDLIVFKQTPEGGPIPHYVALQALLHPPSNKLQLYVETLQLDKGTRKIKSESCCQIF